MHIGETRRSEETELRLVLQQVEQATGNGKTSGNILDRKGVNVGSFSWTPVNS